MASCSLVDASHLPSLPQEIWDEIFTYHALQVSLGSSRRHGGPISSVKHYRERLKTFFVNKGIWSQRIKILHNTTPFELNLSARGPKPRAPSLAHITSNVQFIEFNLLPPLYELDWMNIISLTDALQCMTQQAPRLKELLVSVAGQPTATNTTAGEAQRQARITQSERIMRHILTSLRADVRSSVKVLIVQKKGQFVRCSEEPDPRVAFYKREEWMGMIDDAEIIVNHTGVMIELKR